MPTVVINNEPVAANVGEDLLTVARRNASHIGFVCDGRGMCETCQSTVLAGAENLSLPNEVEQSWLTPEQFAHGDRLACQSRLVRSGSVEILTRSEKIRRQTIAVFNPPIGTNAGENLGALLNTLGDTVGQVAANFPSNVANTWPRFLQMPPYPQGVAQYANDVQRVLTRMAGGSVSRSPAPGVERVRVEVEVPVEPDR